MDMDELTIKTKDLLTFSEAALLLEVSRPTLYNLVTRAKLHPVLIGNNRYLLRAEVEHIKEERSEKPLA